ncbi:MAG: hypothetical protein KA165_11730, partial [Saprospiraceae bacterium]|nr:hypothetical protein [Saprospiraceae bacterium]
RRHAVPRTESKIRPYARRTISQWLYGGHFLPERRMSSNACFLTQFTIRNPFRHLHLCNIETG